jgi:hypothetical protein
VLGLGLGLGLALVLHIVASSTILVLYGFILFRRSSIKLCYDSFCAANSSGDFQKKELDHACWGCPGISVAGVVWEKRDQGLAGWRVEGRDFPVATVLSGHAFVPPNRKMCGQFPVTLIYCRNKCRYRTSESLSRTNSRPFKFPHMHSAPLALVDTI